RSLLGGIENDSLSQAAVLLWWCRKTDRPHVPTHGDDVIIPRRCVDDVDLPGVDLVFEFRKKRCSGRKHREKFSCDQCSPTRISDQRPCEFRWIRIDKRYG